MICAAPKENLTREELAVCISSERYGWRWCMVLKWIGAVNNSCSLVQSAVRSRRSTIWQPAAIRGSAALVGVIRKSICRVIFSASLASRVVMRHQHIRAINGSGGNRSNDRSLFQFTFFATDGQRPFPRETLSNWRQPSLRWQLDKCLRTVICSIIVRNRSKFVKG